MTGDCDTGAPVQQELHSGAQSVEGRFVLQAAAGIQHAGKIRTQQDTLIIYLCVFNPG